MVKVKETLTIKKTRADVVKYDKCSVIYFKKFKLNDDCKGNILFLSQHFTKSFIRRKTNRRGEKFSATSSQRKALRQHFFHRYRYDAVLAIRLMLAFRKKTMREESVTDSESCQ